jgi:hypothetical protein
MDERIETAVEIASCFDSNSDPAKHLWASLASSKIFSVVKKRDKAKIRESELFSSVSPSPKARVGSILFLSEKLFV